MPTYEVALTYTVDDVIIVEAEDEEEALSEAEYIANEKILDNLLPDGLYWNAVDAYDVQRIK